MIRLLAITGFLIFLIYQPALAQSKESVDDLKKRIQMLQEENRQKDYDMIKEESLRKQQKKMEKQAARLLDQPASPYVFGQPQEQLQDEVPEKKVYIYNKSDKLEKPQKVFTDYQ